MSHDHFIRHCLTLAEKGRGNTGINPLVGAVLVREGEIIAEGFHQGFGKPHAEQELAEKIDQKISSEDILYINLEPCCHQGKTPPCTDLIIEKGIKKVVYGMMDPSEKVAGQGIKKLMDAGVEVIGPVLPEMCRRLNRGFVSLHEKGRPWITLKMARTRAGEISNADGTPLKITSEAQDEWAHRNLRAKHDAILVGVQTIITDDPMLNTRFDQTLPQPVPIILDPELRIPVDSKVVREGTVIIKDPKDPKDPEDPKEELLRKGVRIFEVPINNGVFDWNELWKVLTTPVEGFYGITSILVEGGPKTWEAFRSANLVDEEVTLVGSL